MPRCHFLVAIRAPRGGGDGSPVPVSLVPAEVPHLVPRGHAQLPLLGRRRSVVAGGARGRRIAVWLAGLAPGAVLAGYRLEARIGAGGMAVVFRAVDERLGRTVALKVLAPGLVGDGEFRERFVRESRAAATVDHPHIIPVYGAGEADGILFLAMRYVPGGDLRSVLHREGPLQPERAAFLLSRSRRRSTRRTGPGWCTGT